MAQGVVDPFEIIQVDVEHRRLPGQGRCVSLLDLLDGPLQGGGEGVAVPQPGEGIVVGQVLDLLLESVAFGDVADHHQGPVIGGSDEPGLPEAGLHRSGGG